jgi:type IV pilus assembly protein PilB
MNLDTKDNPSANASVASGADVEQTSSKSPIISDEAVAMSIAKTHGVDFIKLSETELSSEIVWLLPQWLVFQHNVIAVKLEEDTLYVAMTNPVDLPTLEQINLATGFNVKPIVAAEKDIIQAINHHYSAETVTKQDMVDAIRCQLQFPNQVDKDVGGLEDLVLSREDGQAVRLISCIIKDAIDSGASDIHFEPSGNEMFIRFRVDGILHDCLTVPTAMRNEVTSRLKFLAKLDITEKRRAQDGHINLKYKQNDYDLRISVVPTIDGEKTVVRVLDRNRLSIELGALGIGAEEQALVESTVTRPHGMVLVTGPTGCGKTTTLYALLRNIDAIAKNIITIENPMEYKLNRVSQIQIDTGGSETFAGTLRSILRQDPDVIMVGEIRDFETAEIAVQAALTGHLVLSTLHTEDAVTAITRLRELGIQPFLIAQYQPDEKILKLLGVEESPPAGFVHGKGCSSCFNTGFHGREGVYEILKIDSDIQTAILQDSNASEIKKTAVQNGMKTLLDSALLKVFAGKTSVEEVKRVIPRQGF